MRHTYASLALDPGVEIFQLARLMGTSSTAPRPVRPALEQRAQREFESARAAREV